MNVLKNKMGKKSGFTLVEMLIVVAIIAILIAIAIPLVNVILERSREATDEANERAAIGIGNAYYLAGGETGKETYADAKFYVYKVNTQKEGELVALSGISNTVTEPGKVTLTATYPEGEGYGQGTAIEGKSDKVNTGKYLVVMIKTPDDTTTPAVSVDWVAGGK